MQTTHEPKTERIDIRTSATVKRLLQQAASAKHQNVSEFLLEHGLAAAEDTLADRRLFVLDDGQWKTFQEALDGPTREKPWLRKLLSEPSIFD
jgi:uncharacterized protein (DUF1778 family)